MALGEISRTILALDKQNRIIADKAKADYNKADEKTERSFDDERIDIQGAGRLQSAESDNARTAGDDFGQIRSDEEEISQGTSQNPVLQSSDELHSDGAFEETEQTALNMEETLMKQMAAQEGLTESLKASDMMKWVQGMNNLRNRVQEIVKAEVIFA